MQKIKHSQRKLLSVLYRQAGSIRLYNDFDYRRKNQVFLKCYSRISYPDFLGAVSFAFSQGLEFAKKHPQYAALADQFSKEDNESVKSAVIKEGDKQAESLFMQMIHNAKTKGEIDSKVDSLALCLLLQSLNSAVNKYMIGKFGGISYEYNQEDINNFVDSLLDIILAGFRIKLIKI